MNENLFTNNESAYEYIRGLSNDLLLLMYEDVDKAIKVLPDKYKQHHLIAALNRQSALVWAFCPNECIHEIFSFENVCLRLHQDVDKVREFVKTKMTDYEIERYAKYLEDNNENN